MRRSLLLPFLSIASPLLFCITCLWLKNFLPLRMLTLFYAHLVVRVGRICVHIILTSLPFNQNSALFLAIAHITRGTNVSTYPLVMFIFLVMLFLTRLFSLFPHFIPMPTLVFAQKSRSFLYPWLILRWFGVVLWMLQICLSLLTPLCSNVPCQNF
jgi:hypothetical protein